MLSSSDALLANAKQLMLAKELLQRAMTPDLKRCRYCAGALTHDSGTGATGVVSESYIGGWMESECSDPSAYGGEYYEYHSGGYIDTGQVETLTKYILSLIESSGVEAEVETFLKLQSSWHGSLEELARASEALNQEE